MTESLLVSGLRLALISELHGAVVLKHADRFKSGIPDMSVTWQGLTSWIEVKFYDNRMFELSEPQTILCKRLAHAGICRYVIYERRHSVSRTLIVQPLAIESWVQSIFTASGFNHVWVAHHLAALHEKVHV